MADPSQLAPKLARTVAAAARVNPQFVREGALLTKRTVLQQAALRGVHGLRLRNAGKNGARLGLNYVISGSPQDQVALIRARGPWQLIENRTSPHDIVPNRHQALKIGDGFAGLVHHPGTPGKHVWRDGTRRAESQLGRVYAKQMSAAISAAFKA